MAVAHLALSDRDFDAICQLVYRHSGIVLGREKVALVTARIAKRVRALGLSGAQEYARLLESERAPAELVKLLDAISTNVTSFFREADHFPFLADFVSQAIASGQRRFRFWCAAASSGEEPYSIAATLADVKGFAQTDTRLLATDINTEVLQKAQRGVYPDRLVAPVPSDIRSRYFRRLVDGDWEVSAALKRIIRFGRLNLKEMPFPMTGPLDLIFCRNVMIYFDNEFRRGLVGEFERLLRPGGCLLVGHSESLAGMGQRMKMVRPSIYQRVP